MPPLNFPCPSCGSMVSTVGLAPGAVPFCSGCGAQFPLSANVAPAFGGGSSTGVAGCGGIVVGAIAILVIAGVAFTLFTGRSSMARHQMQAQDAAQAEAKRQNYARAQVLAAKLSDPDAARALQAWHELAGCDAIDHWGTFDVLSEEFSRTHARNGLWNISNGMQMYYGVKGEDAIARELVARKASDEEVDILCQSLEQYADSVARDRGAAQGNEVRTRAWHVLTKAEAQVDHPGATRRVGLALERVRSKLPAEKR